MRLAGALVVCTVTALPACEQADGWEKDTFLEGGTVELGQDDTEVGRFALITKNAPTHYVSLELDMSLTYLGDTETTVLFSFLPDRPDDPWPAGEREVRLYGPTEQVGFIQEESRACSVECVDVVSLLVERVAGASDGVIRVEWRVVASASGDGSGRLVDLQLISDP